MPLVEKTKRLLNKVFSRRTTKLLKQQNAFLLTQVIQINEKLRYLELGQTDRKKEQTLDSFDYQWKELPTGDDMPSNPQFLHNIEQLICEMTQLPREWFPGKKIIDIGCGLGRFSYGLLSLGAHVTSCDNSSWALQRTKDLCKPFENRSQLMQINLLKDQLPEEQFDLTWCYGVVHHTGNTYLAIKNACKTTKLNGKTFFMIYGFPESFNDFIELNAYDHLRQQLKFMPFESKQKELESQFSKGAVHGWFDAVSPEINDLLTYQEAIFLLTACGVSNIRRTINNRNLHLIGDRN